jgi:hypothetical protein
LFNIKDILLGNGVTSPQERTLSLRLFNIGHFGISIFLGGKRDNVEWPGS